MPLEIWVIQLILVYFSRLFALTSLMFAQFFTIAEWWWRQVLSKKKTADPVTSRFCLIEANKTSALQNRTPINAIKFTHAHFLFTFAISASPIYRYFIDLICPFNPIWAPQINWIGRDWERNLSDPIAMFHRIRKNVLSYFLFRGLSLFSLISLHL